MRRPLVVGLLLVAGCVKCSAAPLRGPQVKNPRGETTLTVRGAPPGCRVTVNGRRWVTGPAAIVPGTARIGCEGQGDQLEVSVPEGFDTSVEYWGP